MLQHRYEEACYSTDMRNYGTAPISGSMLQHRYEEACYSTDMKKHVTAPI